MCGARLYISARVCVCVAGLYIYVDDCVSFIHLQAARGRWVSCGPCVHWVSRLQPTATDPGSGLCALSGVVLIRVFFSWKLSLVYLSEDSRFDGLKQSFSDFKAITVKTHQSGQPSYQQANQYKCIRLSRVHSVNAQTTTTLSCPHTFDEKKKPPLNGRKLSNHLT